MAEVGRRLGVVDPPLSVAELRAYLFSVRPELRATPEARDAVRFLLAPPTSLATRPAYLLVAGAAVGLLPGFVRRELRLPLLPGVEPLVVRPAARTLLEVLGWALGPPPHAESVRGRRSEVTDGARGDLRFADRGFDRSPARAAA